MTTHKPPPRPTAAELAALPFEELANVIESLARCQPGCPESGDTCFSCRSNEIRAARAGELLRRYRELETRNEANGALARARLEALDELAAKYRALEVALRALLSPEPAPPTELTVTCPHCSAGPGRACMGEDGPAQRPHMARIRAAKETP